MIRARPQASRRAIGLIAALAAAAAFASTALAGGGSTLGKPHFQPTGLIETGPVAVADFNGDGRKDIVTAGRSDQVISVLYGSKHGFKPFHTYPSDIVPSWLAIGDLNRDGRPDIVAATLEGFPEVILAKHGGGFKAPVPQFTGHASGFVALADLNHDHKLDIITSNSEPDSNLSVRVGHGDGTFEPAHDVALPIDGDPFTVVVADLNGDGDRDLAVLVNSTDDFGPVVSTLHGDGHAGFTPGNSTISGANHLYGMVAGNFNSDKHLDVVANDCGTVFLFDGAKSGFKGAKEFENDGHACPLEPAAADVNGDGLTDLVTTDEAADGNEVSVMLGKKNGDLGAFHLYRGLKTGKVGRYLAVAGFDRDKRGDVAVVGDTGTRRGVGVLYGKKG